MITMSWRDIIKVDEDKRARYERYAASRKRGGKEKKPDQPKYKCAMCGKALSKYNKEFRGKQINFCKKCQKARQER